MPGIDGVLENSDISCFVIAVAVGRIFGDDLVNGDAAPIANIEIANKLKPGLKTLSSTALRALRYSLRYSLSLVHKRSFLQRIRHPRFLWITALPKGIA